jgi:hypothetical protein
MANRVIGTELQTSFGAWAPIIDRDAHGRSMCAVVGRSAATFERGLSSSWPRIQGAECVEPGDEITFDVERAVKPTTERNGQ